jgi:ribose transport system ATP-binding protein
MNAIEMTGITKRYPGTLALDKVDFSLPVGEIKALVGENGAGKSTLIKILSGAVAKDEGSISIRGEPVHFHGTLEARRYGVGMIYQEFTLVPALTVAENISLGRWPRKALGVDWKLIHAHAGELLKRLNADIDPRAMVSRLSVADQQLVEIAKALATDARILIMDEPTAALSQAETELLFTVIRRLKSDGVSIIFVSHRIEEIFEIADSVTVLRDGVKVADMPIAGVTAKSLVELMIGRQLSPQLYHKDKKRGEVVLKMVDAGKGRHLHGINFTVHGGEIVGITGLVGAGQTPLAQCLFGILHLDSGRMEIAGTPAAVETPAHAIRMGVGLIPEDRRRQGLVLGLPIKENVTLASIREITGFLRLNKKREAGLARTLMETLRIKATGVSQRVGSLSGGNQQKVVIAKWLVNKSRLLIFHEPTRGIDVGAKEEIYRVMQELAGDGAAVLLISSDIEEVLGVSDRIYVMRKGTIVGELDGRATTKERILMLSAVSEG